MDSRRRRLSYIPQEKLARKPRARWVLSFQAKMWRCLMSIGMFLHKISPPRPRSPTFHRDISTTIASTPGRIRLHFYVPHDWKFPLRSELAQSPIIPEDEPISDIPKKYALVINFHGGGFALGKATDDARWCNAVVDDVGAVVVSVDYRLAPEYPFPTAVEDGADALLYLINHAEEFRIDTNRVAVSGFSAGANMAFTTPLRLLEELVLEAAEGEMRRNSVISKKRPALMKSMSQGRTLTRVSKHLSVKAIIAWYPPVDYTRTRAQRRATAKRIDQQLPQIFTDLFDDSYLSPPTMDMSSPYLSPGVAPKHLLAGLPEEIAIFACEWDMLFQEAETFANRLKEDLGKIVHFNVVPNAPHGFDKAPNPIKLPENITLEYKKATSLLKNILA